MVNLLMIFKINKKMSNATIATSLNIMLLVIRVNKHTDMNSPT